MFKNVFNTCRNLNNFFIKKKINKYYKSLKINSTLCARDIFIHTGNSLIWRNFTYLFLGRQIKYNVFFKKPLVRPTKKKKK